MEGRDWSEPSNHEAQATEKLFTADIDKDGIPISDYKPVTVSNKSTSS